MSIKPPALKPGDKIGVFSPSSWVDKEDIEKSKSLLEQLGFEVFIHPQTYERENQSAGSTLQKTLAFQGLWQRKDINAIWAAGGGNRCTHILDCINFKNITEPKILIGFSDVTSLLNTLYAKTNITTFHGPVFKNLHKYNETDHLLSLLSGDRVKYPLSGENIIKDGKASGHFVGGNLSLLQYLPETLENDIFTDALLFIEDCNEELSRIDRMLLHLKRTGTLAKANALLFGQFSDILESGKPFGYTLEDIIKEHTEGLDIPILYNLLFGHDKNLYTFPIGYNASIDTQKLTFELDESATI